MANPNRVIGQAKIKVDAQLLETDRSATLEIGGPIREEVSGDYQAGNFSESTGASKLTCKILAKAGVSADAIRRIDNATITFEADTGQNYVMRNAWSAENVTLNQSDGKFDAVFIAPPAEEF